ncbi:MULTISPECIES: heat-inducible transcriptional repressor HrcA [unclassified Jeotgalibaca]|uniref:heat-inducible transcriptional repressor HrcA n=1 Tax=unclassified Jeotgalibaca TaxID=2621505 RepID=UPI003FD3DCE2
MLTERQLLILNSIIKHYIQHGEPMGSKTLLKETNLSVSPATIRNEMMHIEELGFLEKMHSSSGRIPSNLGYRHYVDLLLKSNQKQKQDGLRRKVQESIRAPYKEAEEILETSAEMLSFMTNYTALSIGPEKMDSRLSNFQLVPITSGHYMAILVTDKGYVENKIFTVSKDVDAAKIQTMVNIFNEELVGLRLIDVHRKLQMEIPDMIRKYIGKEINLQAIFHEVISKMSSDRIYVGGEMNLLNHFNLERIHEREQMKAIISLIHESKDLLGLLTKGQEDLNIQIGPEMKNDLLSNFSLITATYDVGQNSKGLIALLGPTNMPYDQIINIMRITRDELSDSMHDFYQDE